MSPRLALLWAAALVLSAFPASAQSVTFSTTTYASNNLWYPHGGPNSSCGSISTATGEKTSSRITPLPGRAAAPAPLRLTLSTGDGAYAGPVCYTLPAGVAVVFRHRGLLRNWHLDVAVTNEQGNLYIYKNGAGNGTLTLTTTA